MCKLPSLRLETRHYVYHESTGNTPRVPKRVFHLRLNCRKNVSHSIGAAQAITCQSPRDSGSDFDVCQPDISVSQATSPTSALQRARDDTCLATEASQGPPISQTTVPRHPACHMRILDDRTPRTCYRLLITRGSSALVGIPLRYPSSALAGKWSRRETMVVACPSERRVRLRSPPSRHRQFSPGPSVNKLHSLGIAG